jgi:hypothetical protein
MLVDYIFAQGESIDEGLADDSVDESVLMIMTLVTSLHPHAKARLILSYIAFLHRAMPICLAVAFRCLFVDIGR